MDTLREIIRKNLKYYIENSKYNQVEIAKMLNISKASVTNWIKGKNSPNIEYLDQLCSILNISINDIFSSRASLLNYTQDEENLIQNYRSLNVEGKEKVRSYIDDLLDSPKYKKCDKSILVQEA